MTGTTYKILGCVKDPDTGDGVPGLLVSWAKVVSTPGGSASFAYTTTTDANGEFEYNLGSTAANTLLGADGTEDITLHVVEDGTEIITQTITLTWSRLLLGYRFCLETPSTQPPPDPPPGEGDCMYFVTGRLLGPNGEVYGDNVTVKAMSKTLRNEVELASGSPFGTGAYSLAYGANAPCDPESPNIDLIVVVCDNNGDEIGRSDVWCNPPRVAQVDVVIGDGTYVGRPLLDVYVAAITPHLDGAAIEDLTGDDAGFLSCKAGFDPVTIARVARAHALAVEAQALGVTVPAAAFFAFLTAALPRDLGPLTTVAAARLRTALEEAEARNLVSAWSSGEIDNILAAMVSLAVAVEFAPTEPQLFAALVAAAGHSVQTGQDLLAAWRAHTGTKDELWTDFEASHPGTSDDLRFVFDLAPLVGNYVSLVQVLVAQRNSGDFSMLAELAPLTAQGWEDLLTDGTTTPPAIGAPPGFKGADEAERLDNYSSQTALRFENAFPTAASTRVAVSASNDDVAAFFTLNPTFDLDARISDDVNDYAFPGSVSTQPEQEALLADLRLRQRVHAVAPENDKAKVAAALAADPSLPIRSAQQIVQMGRGPFIDHFSTALGVSTAEEVFTRAQRVTSGLNQIVAAQHSLSGPAIYGNPGASGWATGGGAIPPVEEGGGFEGIENIVGPLGFCECQHCKSIFGPAAYLADVLQWLKQHSFAAPDDAYGAIRTRRLDIFQVLLNCENTNTTLPQIDLVNELLEARVVGSDPGDRQTSWTRERLLVHPEHLDPAAYGSTRLAGGGPNGNPVHPWGLPWSLWWAEAREYLKIAGTTRADLMERAVWQPDQAHMDRIYRERVGLSPEQADIVFDPSYTLQDAWRLTGDYVGILENVKPLLAQSGLTLSELEDLLPIKYVGHNVFPQKWIISYEEGKECQLEGAFITTDGSSPQVGFTADVLDRIHRFTRLRRALGWTAEELDIALHTLSQLSSDPITDDDVPAELAHMVQLRERFPDVPFEDLAAWGGTLLGWRYEDNRPPFVTNAFVSAAVDPDPAFPPARADFVASADGTQLEGEGNAYTPAVHASLISAGIGATRSEFDTITSAPNVVGNGAYADVGSITAADIWAVRRNKTLATALALSVGDMFDIRDASETLPFGPDPADPTITAVMGFADIVDDVRASGLTAKELAYVLLNRYAGDPAVGMAPRDRMTFLLELIRGMIKIQEGAVGSSGQTAIGRFEAVLGALVAPEDVSTLFALVEKRNPFSDGGLDPTDADDFFGTLADEQQPRPLDLPVGVRDTLKDHTGGSDDFEARAQEVLDAVEGLVPDRLRRNLVVEAVATSFGIAPGTARLLLRELESDSQVLLLDVLQAPTLADPSVIDLEADADAIAEDGFEGVYRQRLAAADAVLEARVFDAIARLHKSALLVRAHGLDSLTMGRLLSDTLVPAGVFLDFRSLTSDGSSGPGFTAWRNLARFAKVRDQLFEDGASLLDLMARVPELPNGVGTSLAIHDNGPNPDADVLKVMNFRQALADATGWYEPQIRALAEEYALTAATVTIDASGPRMDLFGFASDMFDLEEATAAGPDKLHTWATGSLDRDLAFDIKNTVTGRAGIEGRGDIIRPVRDRLREQQRDALVSWVQIAEGFTTEDELFAYLLIDPRVSPCMLTSRVRQAMSSVQTFIQRVILNLEEVSLRESAQETWRAMSRYRVWEAARKIFVYPENWVLPELRTDKSELFEELEKDLLAGDLNDETVEIALTRYLEGLDVVARLDTAGVAWEEERDETGRIVGRHLHVVGVRPGKPNRHFYRKWVNKAYWTPWEELPFQIGQRDVLVEIHDRRLWLFWLKIEERTNEPDKIQVQEPDADGNVDAPKPDKYKEIRLVYTRMTADGWASAEETEGYFDDNFVGDTYRLPGSISRNATRTPATMTSYRTSGINSGELVIEIGWMATGVSGLFLSRGAFRQSRCRNKWRKIGTRSYGILYEINRLDGQKSWISSRVVPTKLPAPDGSLPEGQAFEWNGDDVEVGDVQFPYWSGPKRKIEQTDRIISFPNRYEVYTSHDRDFLSDTPAIYQDPRRSFVFEPAAYVGSGVDPVGEGFTNIPNNQPSGEPPAPEHPSPVATVDAAAAPVHEPVALAAVPATQSNASSLGLAATIADGESPSQTVTAGPSARPTSWPGAFRIHIAYHPYVCTMLSAVRRFGVDGLYKPRSGSLLDRQGAEAGPFNPNAYNPSDLVRQPYPVEEFDFLYGGTYSEYNWELFFHAPMLIADRLMAEQRYAEAQRWLHYIFDPTSTRDEEAPRRFWNMKVFNEDGVPDSILHALQALAAGGGATIAVSNLAKRTAGQIERWRLDPFDPHLVASLRPAAYQRSVIMKYLDLLIEWGDSLFRQDTLESVNEAFQLYVLGASFLGPRPEEAPEQTLDPQSIDQLGDLDSFGNEIIELENRYPTRPPTGESSTYARDHFGGFSLYFCVPPNDKLIRYWDTIADRLFKIRNCLNIEGVRRDLALFDPPIDPLLLARAAAAGIDLGTALRTLLAPLPHYRFRSMLRLAKEVAQEVKSLGQTLLSALEKQDAELLAQLRATHENRLIAAQRTALEQGVAEAEQARVSLSRAADVTRQRRDHYQELLNNPRIPQETSQKQNLRTSIRLTKASIGFTQAATIAARFPDLKIGLQGWTSSPELTTTLGGSLASRELSAIASELQSSSGIASTKASIEGNEASFLRREQDWGLQIEQAQRELDRIDQDQVVADIRVEIAKRRLEEHEVQRENAEEAREFLHDKFTNDELYGWMVREVKRVHFQAYQLGVDLARRTERTYQHELADDDASFVQPSHYDSQRKGLLAGEMLVQDLQRMETAYQENNTREFELTTQVSLASIDPVALLRLRETGTAHFSVPEAVFDLDHPGMYLRRIKSVRVTMPAVTGPYTSIGCKLTLAKSEVRRTSGANEEPVVDRLTTSHSIATSTAQNDAGLFNENFEDERYLPFEGKGVVSDWVLELPNEVRQFDYDTISDAILTFSYTARYDGALRKRLLEDGELATKLDALQRARATEFDDDPEEYTGLTHAFSARQDFPDALNQFLTDPNTTKNLALALVEDRFPNRPQPGTLSIRNVFVFLRYGGTVPAGGGSISVSGAGTGTLDAGAWPAAGSDLLLVKATDALVPGTTGTWTFGVPDSLATVDLEDVVVVVEYSVAQS